MRYVLLLSLAGITVACGSDSLDPVGPDPEAPCNIAQPRCLSSIEIGNGLFLRYYRTHDVSGHHPGITAAVIIVHGANRNADDYFTTAVVATRAADRLDSTIVLAPNFLTADDFPAIDEAYWTSSGWKRGHLSVSDPFQSDRVSSYAAMDRVIEALANRTTFGDLRSIVVAGHSAGGQYVHRYAAGNRTEQTLAGISVQYLVANPSSYLYLGSERAVAGSTDTFELPDTSACPDYNGWHYGLENLNTYMREVSLDQIRSQLVDREVTYLLGNADSLSASLDVSCRANLQGPYRYLRGVTLFSYMEAYYPSHRHDLRVVDGVGHSSRGMFTSEVGLEVLFP